MALDENEAELLDALHEDLGKPPVEAWVSEIGYLRQEIRHALRHLKSWTKLCKVRPPVFLWPSKARIVPEPLGPALVIGPWNYPLQLLLAPAIAAIAAGNPAVLKPSELAPQTGNAVAELVSANFPQEWLTVRPGGHEMTNELIDQKPSIIFFTGGPGGGSAVLQRAATHRIPTVLELGGKSPAIVGPDAPISTTARRIAWGKFLNAGQTCIAPDHLWVHRDQFEPMVKELQAAIREFYGDDPSKSTDYGRICHNGHFERLVRLMGNAEILHGGNTIKDIRYIEPTILGEPDSDTPLAAEEIFGPLLPIRTYNDPAEIIDARKSAHTPLAMYLFTKDPDLEKQFLTQVRSAGVCVNDTISHILPPQLPFGGLGASGFGSYHGKAGFDTFSHHRTVMKRSFFGENSMRYPPAKMELPKLKKLFRWFGM